MLQKDMTLDLHDADFHVIKKLGKYSVYASKGILLWKKAKSFHL